MDYYTMSASNNVADRSFFRDFDRERCKYVVKSFYQDLVCTKCGKIDELTAVAREHLACPGLNLKADFQLAFDGIYVVSKVFADLLDEYCKGSFVFYNIHNTSQHFAVTPRELLSPNFLDNSYRYTGLPCDSCGRHWEVLSSTNVPKIHKVGLTAYRCENTTGVDMEFIVDQNLYTLIHEKRKFSGVVFSKFSASVGNFI